MPDPGPFVDVAVADRTVCGRRADDTFAWAHPDHDVWDATPPPGVDVDSGRGGRFGFCGLDRAGRVHCWGGWESSPLAELMPP